MSVFQAQGGRAIIHGIDHSSHRRYFSFNVNRQYFHIQAIF